MGSKDTNREAMPLLSTIFHWLCEDGNARLVVKVIIQQKNELIRLTDGARMNPGVRRGREQVSATRCHSCDFLFWLADE